LCVGSKTTVIIIIIVVYYTVTEGSIMKEKRMAGLGEVGFAGDWGPNWDRLRFRRLKVEKNGPETGRKICSVIL
jgi:hypothetical protein